MTISIELWSDITTANYIARELGMTLRSPSNTLHTMTSPMLSMSSLARVLHTFDMSADVCADAEDDVSIVITKRSDR